ncbi:MAG: class I SAM-dependent DNA methyltransferase [Opitutae bacterium]|nr:class I SAM-dependent DNA methyltransferase [Opitutae bacterium]
MPLSWNEIKARAIAFSRDWAEETRETAEAKSFWDAFFNVFGLNRRAVASFEEPVRSIQGTYNRIDLFWKGRLLAEHKSAGKDLGKAKGQAFDYVQDLVREGRAAEAPRYIVVTDFARIQLYDLEAADRLLADFPLKEFHRHIKHFAFIAGYKQHAFAEEPAVNLKAAELMAKLCDTLDDAGYPDHQRQVFLVRLLFCLFANDTGIFDSNAFDLLVNESASDGKDLGPRLAEFFDTLNVPRDRRQTTLDDSLAGLPYVNGGLFAAPLPIAHFNTAMREALLDATRFDWSRISPAVFGALFQGVMEPRARRQIGAHYTSEANILKVIRPLFLDALQDDLQKAGSNHAALDRLHEKIANLKFLDPACGCGNFLVIAYREIRAIENELLFTLHQGQTVFDISHIARVNVDQFFGIEIDEWPARIAEVAMWLMDHLMNRDLAEKLGKPLIRLPLTKSAAILHANALRADWKDLLPPKECSYVMGNPPFVGGKFQSPEQRADQEAVCGRIKGFGLLDFVTTWYFIAADYMRTNPAIRCAFVSTNSITQGEQAGVLWPELLRLGIQIHFAYRTFPWDSEARRKAHVHVVVIGFGFSPTNAKTIYEVQDGVTIAIQARNINPYLCDGPDVVLQNRTNPLCDVPEIGIGNKPIDGGNYLFTDEEKAAFLKLEPAVAEFFRPWIGSDEFINGWHRWCLWLGDCPPQQLRQMPEAMKRVQAVQDLRRASKSPPTQKLADTPTRFHVENMPDGPMLVLPEVSSERRFYIPIGFMNGSEVLCGNKVRLFPNASLYHFGILTSAMHMAWMRQVTGRLEMRYQYSIGIVYNNFPWPEKITDARRAEIERLAQAVLDERAKHMEIGATLADLYDPITMPPGLAKAHAALDRAVDRAYRSAPFDTERARVEHLFTLYQSLTTLFPEKPKKKPRRARTVTP